MPAHLFAHNDVLRKSRTCKNLYNSPSTTVLRQCCDVTTDLTVSSTNYFTPLDIDNWVFYYVIIDSIIIIFY